MGARGTSLRLIRGGDTVDADPAWPPPVLIGVGSEPAPRTLTARHTELLRELAGAHPSSGWSTHALRECLSHLRTSTVTQARRVRVVDAWTDGP